mgnify:FL=1
MRLPPPLSWLWEGWKKFGHAMGLVMSTIFLTVIWIVLFGLYGVILRIVGLFRGRQPDPATFWIDVEPTAPESYRQQF